MNNVILSGRYPQFYEQLSACGYRVILSDTVSSFIPYERDHADMQCLVIDKTAFVLSCCERLAAELEKRFTVVRCGEGVAADYPANVALNALVIGKRLIGRFASLEDKVLEYAASHGYEFINIRQGYAKCSCAVVSDNAVITADHGVYRALSEHGIDVLLIEEGRVTLAGADHGFIGGASGLEIQCNKRTLYFSGNIEKHPSHERIEAFCKQYNTEIISLMTDDELIDIGGMIFC